MIVNNIKEFSGRKNKKVMRERRFDSMSANRRLFTSESVTEGHPDKMSDQISDAVLDAILKEDPMARVACETTVTTGLVLVSGEITTSTYVDIPKIVRQTVKEIGYDDATFGFDYETCAVRSEERRVGTGCGSGSERG